MNSKITPVLTVLLVIVSFLAGSMYTRVRMMESDSDKTQEQAGQVTIAPQQQAPEPVVLGAEDRAQIEESKTAVKGSENAKITIVEFSEYECPFCKRYVDQAYAQIMDKYGDSIRYIFRDYPLDFHKHSKPLANAARCAGEQNNYWQMHDMLFDKRDDWAQQEDATEAVIGYAGDLGLDTVSFRQCVVDSKYDKEVEADFALGQKMGVSGTPSFYINGRQLVGAQPFEAFKAVIEEELAK